MCEAKRLAKTHAMRLKGSKMSGSTTEVKSVVVEINALLSKYIEIHDAIFKFSWRKIIPLPFLFKPIDFAQLHSSAEQILSQLETCNQQVRSLTEDITQKENRLAHFLCEYCMALMETVSLLKGIIHQLQLKSEASRRYSLTEHKRQCGLYKNAVDRYSTMGSQLNQLYQEIA